MRTKILVLGSVNTDLVIRGPRLPGRGETVLGGEFYRAAGGKGANQAVAAARLGTEPVTFVAAVGDDDFGRTALAGFARENLDCRYIKTVAGRPSGVALILVDERGENLISVASGANVDLTPADVDKVPVSTFDDAAVFLACLESPLRTVARAVERAKAAGCQTILNPAPADRALLETGCLSRVDVITPNASEATVLTEVSVTDDASAVTAAQALCQWGCRSAIITLGSAGCVVFDDGQPTHVPAQEVTSVDSTAAGDAFNGALAVALAEGRTLAEAARWASTAAAISVTRAGAQPSLPMRAELGAGAAQT
jgi:ribokinase